MEVTGRSQTSFVTIDNTAGYMRPSVSGWLPDGALGSRFVYDENINASYLQVGYEKDRLKISAGLRLEHTHVHGDLEEIHNRKTLRLQRITSICFLLLLCNTV